MRTAIFILLTFVCGEAHASQPKPEAVKAWDHYIALTQTRVDAQQRDIQNFLYPKNDSAEQKVATEAKLKSGEIIVRKLQTTDDGKEIEAPGALIHHWMGTAFIEKATIKQAFAVLQDYDHHSTTYAP